MIKEKAFAELKYLVSYPDGFCADNKYPLVVFLHGAGTRSENIEVLKNNACFCNIRKQQTRGFILLAPLCSVHNWNEVTQSVIAIVENAIGLDYVDEKRVYLTGNSMGGYGTWELAAMRPEWFAAIMPICGGGIAGFAQRLIDIPIRTFHGLCDTVVDPLDSLQMAKAVNRAGGYAELILFPQLDHNCWDRVYTTEENYDWLFQFTSDRDKTEIEKITGENYG